MTSALLVSLISAAMVDVLRRASIGTYGLVLALMCLACQPALADEGLPVELQLKVVGELHGVIQDQLPVEVSIEFATPGKRDLLLTVDDIAARTELLKSYIVTKRGELLQRLSGPGLVVDETFDYIPVVHATITTYGALVRVLSDPAVVSVMGDDKIEVEDLTY